MRNRTPFFDASEGEGNGSELETAAATVIARYVLAASRAEPGLLMDECWYIDAAVAKISQRQV